MKPHVVLPLLFAATTLAASAEPLRSDHPLVGAWQLTLDGCAEVYRLDRSGSMLVTSADEVSEARMQISDQPSAKGFYKWVDTVVRDNGKKDCSGRVTPAGEVGTVYIVVGPKGDRFLMCEREDIQTCIGPLVRLEDPGV